MKLEPCIILNLSLKFSDFEPQYPYKLYSYNSINLYINTLGAFSSYSTDFSTILKDLSIEDRHLTYSQRKISTITRDVEMGDVGGVTPPMFSNLLESSSKFSHAAREVATEFSVNFHLVAIAGQLVKTPYPQR